MNSEELLSPKSWFTPPLLLLQSKCHKSATSCVCLNATGSSLGLEIKVLQPSLITDAGWLDKAAEKCLFQHVERRKPGNVENLCVVLQLGRNFGPTQLKEEELFRKSSSPQAPQLPNLASAIKLDWMETSTLEQSAFFRGKSISVVDWLYRNQKAISFTKQPTASIMAESHSSILLLIICRVVGTGAHLWPLFHQKQPRAGSTRKRTESVYFFTAQEL